MEVSETLEKLDDLVLTSDESILKVTFSKKGKMRTVFGLLDNYDQKPGGHLVIDTGEDDERRMRIPLKSVVNVELIEKRPFVAFLNAIVAGN